MRDRAQALRRPRTDDPALDAAFRDIDDYMRGTLRVVAVPQFDALYTEPFYVSLPAEPLALLCLRVRQVGQLATPLVVIGCTVPFEWDGAQSRAKVGQVYGLVVNTEYRFNFATVSQ